MSYSAKMVKYGIRVLYIIGASIAVFFIIKQARKIVQLGPRPKPNDLTQRFGPKRNTKFTLNHPPPTTTQTFLTEGIVIGF